MSRARLSAALERAIGPILKGEPGPLEPVGLGVALEGTIRGSDPLSASTTIARAASDAARKLSTRLDLVTVAVTGSAWIGSGAGSVEAAMLRTVEDAEHEVLVTAYSITRGSSRVLDALESAVAAGISVSLVVDGFEKQYPSVQDRLLDLVRQYPETFAVYSFDGNGRVGGLHAKILVSDRQCAVVGSANLTFHGMLAAHELAVVVEGPSAEAIADRIYLLMRSSQVRRVQNRIAGPI